MEKGEDSEDLVEVRRREVLARWRSGEASEVEGRRWRGGKWKRGLREKRGWRIEWIVTHYLHLDQFDILRMEDVADAS